MRIYRGQVLECQTIRARRKRIKQIRVLEGLAVIGLVILSAFIAGLIIFFVAETML